MKKTIGFLLAFVLVFGLSACSVSENKAADNGAKENTVSDAKGSIGTVNGKDIMQSDYDALYNSYVKMLAKQNDIDGNVKKILTDEALLMQDLEKNGVKVTDEDIKKMREEKIADIGGEEQFKKGIEEEGFSEDLFNKFVELQAYSKAHVDWFNKNNPVSKEDAKKYYDEHKAEINTIKSSHILVDTEEEAKKILERIENGEEFADVAKEVSKDEGSKVVGGELGERALENTGFDPDFDAALKALKVGEISKPVKTQFGYHIIKLDELKDKFEDFEEKLKEDVNQSKYMEYYQNLEKNAEVKFNDEEAKEDEAEKAEPEKAEGESEKTEEEQAPSEENTEEKSDN